MILASSAKNAVGLSAVVGAMKSLIALDVNHDLGRHGSVWQYNYYERVIRNEEELGRVREYIIRNPEALNIDWKAVGIDEPSAQAAQGLPLRQDKASP